MNLANYYEQFQGLQGANRSIAYTGYGNAKREVMAVDYGAVWQVAKTVSIEDQVNYNNAHQPGISGLTSGTTVTVPTTAGQETINNTTGLTTCTTTNGTTTPVTTSPAGCKPTTSAITGGAAIGGTQAGYFGQRFMTNDSRPTLGCDAAQHLYPHVPLSGSPDLRRPGNCASQRSDPAQQHDFRRGDHSSKRWDPSPRPCARPTTGISTAAPRYLTPTTPLRRWDSGSSSTTGCTPSTAPKSWATVSGAFNDLERHNNTNNNQNFPGNTTPYFGPLNHVDHSRFASFGTELFPNERYGLDLNYSYSDVYMSDNICFQGAANAMPGGGSRTCRCRRGRFALRRRRSRPRVEQRALWAGQGFSGRSHAVRIGRLHVHADQEVPLQPRLSRQLRQRQPVLHRCQRRQWLRSCPTTRLPLSVLIGRCIPV